MLITTDKRMTHEHMTLRILRRALVAFLSFQDLLVVSKHAFVWPNCSVRGCMARLFSMRANASLNLAAVLVESEHSLVMNRAQHCMKTASTAACCGSCGCLARCVEIAALIPLVFHKY